jgi:hypothetical protein
VQGQSPPAPLADGPPARSRRWIQPRDMPRNETVSGWHPQFATGPWEKPLLLVGQYGRNLQPAF